MDKENVFTLDINRMGTSDIASLANILNWLADHTLSEEIASIGFNTSSGNVYAYFENSGMTIISSFGNDVSFMDSEENIISQEEFLVANK